MSDEVYRASNRKTTHKIYHADDQCYFLRTALNILSDDRDALEDRGFRACKNCTDEAGTGGRENPHELVAKLSHPDFGPEDLGLSPIGGKP